MFERKDLSDLTAQDLAALEVLMQPTWSETWRDLATSFYLTLICMPGAQAVAQDKLAQLAVELVLGVAEDMGGTQPYIAVGAEVMKSARFKRVIELRQRGLSYKAVATAVGITAARVRRIEHAWRKEQFAARQHTLPLMPAVDGVR